MEEHNVVSPSPIVVDGNHRLHAIRSILQDHFTGAHVIDTRILHTLLNPTAVVLSRYTPKHILLRIGAAQNQMARQVVNGSVLMDAEYLASMRSDITILQETAEQMISKKLIQRLPWSKDENPRLTGRMAAYLLKQREESSEDQEVIEKVEENEKEMDLENPVVVGSSLAAYALSGFPRIRELCEMEVEYDSRERVFSGRNIWANTPLKQMLNYSREDSENVNVDPLMRELYVDYTVAAVATIFELTKALRSGNMSDLRLAIGALPNRKTTVQQRQIARLSNRIQIRITCRFFNALMCRIWLEKHLGNNTVMTLQAQAPDAFARIKDMLCDFRAISTMTEGSDVFFDTGIPWTMAEVERNLKEQMEALIPKPPPEMERARVHPPHTPPSKSILRNAPGRTEQRVGEKSPRDVRAENRHLTTGIAGKMPVSDDEDEVSDNGPGPAPPSPGPALNHRTAIAYQNARPLPSSESVQLKYKKLALPPLYTLQETRYFPEGYDAADIEEFKTTTDFTDIQNVLKKVENVSVHDNNMLPPDRFPVENRICFKFGPYAIRGQRWTTAVIPSVKEDLYPDLGGACMVSCILYDHVDFGLMIFIM